MKLRGGYNILLAGKPDSVIKTMPEVDALYLPLQSRRFVFSEICVREGQEVYPGDILAKDPGNYAVPLLAPRKGVVQVKTVEGHIVLKSGPGGTTAKPAEDAQGAHIAREMGAGGIKRYKLLSLGAWEYFYDAYSGKLPDPLGTPQAIIVSTLSLEPFMVRGDVLLKERLLNFTRGLEQLQSLLEYQPIYLILPDIKSELARQVREHLRGYAWIKLVEVPPKYAYDNFTLLARHLGLKKSVGGVWGVRVEGVLAIDQALTAMKPCLERTIAIGGPAVNFPCHLQVPAGYPIAKILEAFVSEAPVRVINGGMLTGEPVTTATRGLAAGCRGLTVLREAQQREFLGFMRPGWDRHSYSNCFLSSVRAEFSERLTTAFRGELRPCIGCGFCEDVCPAGIMPHQIHKLLYRDLIEEADQAGIHFCVECGLCAYVCPSKLDLRRQFIEAKSLIEAEKEELRLAQEKHRKEESVQNILEVNRA